MSSDAGESPIFRLDVKSCNPLFEVWLTKAFFEQERQMYRALDVRLGVEGERVGDLELQRADRNRFLTSSFA
jgi:hypothetical protein